MLKNALIYTFILTFFVTLAANAYTTNEELTSPESLMNYNFSQVTAEHVQLVKAQNANRPYKSPRYSKKKWWVKAWEYFDPSADNGYLLQHDIKPSPHWTDL